MLISRSRAARLSRSKEAMPPRKKKIYNYYTSKAWRKSSYRAELEACGELEEFEEMQRMNAEMDAKTGMRTCSYHDDADFRAYIRGEPIRVTHEELRREMGWDDESEEEVDDDDDEDEDGEEVDDDDDDEDDEEGSDGDVDIDGNDVDEVNDDADGMKYGKKRAALNDDVRAELGESTLSNTDNIVPGTAGKRKYKEENTSLPLENDNSGTGGNDACEKCVKKVAR